MLGWGGGAVRISQSSQKCQSRGMGAVGQGMSDRDMDDAV